MTLLCDDLSGPVSMKAEHGFSALLEVEGRSFLWDCGQTDVAVHNALAMGLDLRRLEGIGISHGHYDHTGGLPAVLSCAGPKRIFMHPAALEPRYCVSGEEKRYIGIPHRMELLESLSAGIEFSRGPVEVLPGVRMTGEVTRVTGFEGREADLYRMADGKMLPDTFADDQALVVDTPEGAVVLTGCAHSGLVNILKQVLQSSKRIRAVIGGTHLGRGASRERVEASLDFLEEVLPEKIVACHCTGFEVMAMIAQRFKDRAVPGHSGLVIS